MRNRFAVHLDGGELNPAAGPVAAAGHQARETNFVDFAEIRMGAQISPLGFAAAAPLLSVTTRSGSSLIQRTLAR